MDQLFILTRVVQALEIWMLRLTLHRGNIKYLFLGTGNQGNLIIILLSLDRKKYSSEEFTQESSLIK